jgi:vacuolar-type H+-ATPase subunit I/STV1
MNAWAQRLFGLALVITGLVLWLRGHLEIPTRRGDAMTHLVGLSMFCFGLSPVLVGGSLTWAAGKPQLMNSLGLRLVIGAGISCMVLALLLAKPS